MKKSVLISAVAIFGIAASLSTASAKTSKHAWLGVAFQTVDQEIAEVFDLGIDYGVVINDVIDDSPAEDAGLQEDDIIIAIDGSRIADDDDLQDIIADSKPGNEITITVMRGDKEKETTVTLGKLSNKTLSWYDSDDNQIGLRGHNKFKKIRKIRIPNTPGTPKSLHYSFEFDDKAYSYIGVSLLNISPELADYLGADGHGSLINEVEDNSPAEEAGLKAGDVIVKVGDDKIREAGDVAETIREMEEGEKATINIIRDKRAQTIEVEVKLREENSFSNLHNLQGLDNFDFYSLIDDNDDVDGNIKIEIEADDIDDIGDFKSEMNELRNELRKLKKELKELRKDGN